ncbi:MAG: hypothetical protein OIN88_09880 [Candidatus Methanoperedens sp.]|nr:hypothetical protein [Candidatus Methanoperedens sp.]
MGSLTAQVNFMSECFLCHTAIEPANDAEIEGVELCVDCCERLDAVISDYLTSSPGGLDLLLDVIADDLENPEGRLKDTLKEIIKEVQSEK